MEFNNKSYKTSKSVTFKVDIEEYDDQFEGDIDENLNQFIALISIGLSKVI